LMSHVFAVPEPYSWSKTGRGIVFLVIVGTFCMIFAGSVLHVYSFQFEGAAGLLGQRSFSLYSTATAISNTGETVDFGTRLIQITFILFGMIIPLMHMASLVILWVTPMSLPSQQRFFVLTEILNAWSALEVFVVSVIVALLELPTFAQFIIGDMCDIPNDLITTLDHSTPPAGHANDLIWRMLTNIGHGEDKCFDVKAVLEPGCWILFAAFMIAIIVIQLVTRSCAQAMDERLYRRTGRISTASELDHVVPARLAMLEDEELDCNQRCAARNKECNRKVALSFFSCLSYFGIVVFEEDDEDEDEDAAFSDYNAWTQAHQGDSSEDASEPSEDASEPPEQLEDQDPTADIVEEDKHSPAIM